MMNHIDLLLGQKIFEYDSYREFLRDYFAEQKKLRKSFSYRYFARRVGFSSHSFCDNIIQGKRNLSLESAIKLTRGMKMKAKAAQYFQSLVLYNQATTAEERSEHFREMERIRKSIQFYKIQMNQYPYYSAWYIQIIRELVVYSDWNGDYSRLAQMLRPSISANQAQSAVKFLTETGLVIKGGDGRYRQADPIVTSEEVPGHIMRSMRTEYMLRAMEASEDLPKEERHIAYATLAMSRKTFEEVTQLLDEIRKKILVSALEDKVIDNVYVLNIQAFPVTRDIRHA
jgi:uncharacterized protein (TIGR02147 family)